VQRRIHLADDDAATRQLLTELLGALGYHTAAFADGEALANAVVADRPDAVVTDQDMPRWPGLHAVAHFRRAGVFCPVLVLTGDPSPAVVEAGRSLEPCEILAKPIDLPQLQRALRRALPMSPPPADPLRTSSTPRRDFDQLRAVLVVFDDPQRGGQATSVLAEHCPSTRVQSARTLGEAARLASEQPFTVIVGAHRLPDGPLSDLVTQGLDRPVLVIVDEGEEISGVEAVLAGAIDWAVWSAATRHALPDIVLGVAREWRELGLRRAAEAQLRHADRLALVGRTAATTLHEIATPLNVVRLRAQLLERDPSALGEAVRSIVEQCDRITAMARGMLDLARRDSGTGPVDLAGLAAAARDLLEPACRKQSVTMRIDGPEASVVGRSGELLQIVLNLVTNALDAMPDGGELAVAVTRGDGLARLSVADTGTGIAPEDIPHIFAPFFTTKPAGRGTGLGLSVSAQIAEAHGGHITAESAVGHGARFVLELPLASPGRR